MPQTRLFGLARTRAEALDRRLGTGEEDRRTHNRVGTVKDPNTMAGGVLSGKPRRIAKRWVSARRPLDCRGTGGAAETKSDVVATAPVRV